MCSLRFWNELDFLWCRLPFHLWCGARFRCPFNGTFAALLLSNLWDGGWVPTKNRFSGKHTSSQPHHRLNSHDNITVVFLRWRDVWRGKRYLRLGLWNFATFYFGVHYTPPFPKPLHNQLSALERWCWCSCNRIKIGFVLIDGNMLVKDRRNNFPASTRANRRREQIAVALSSPSSQNSEVSFQLKCSSGILCNHNLNFS